MILIRFLSFLKLVKDLKTFEEFHALHMYVSTKYNILENKFRIYYIYVNTFPKTITETIQKKYFSTNNKKWVPKLSISNQLFLENLDSAICLFVKKWGEKLMDCYFVETHCKLNYKWDKGQQNPCTTRRLLHTAWTVKFVLLFFAIFLTIIG